MVEPLGQPHLADPDCISATRLVDEIVYHIGSVGAFGEHYSGRHIASNGPRGKGYSRRRPSARLDSKACDIDRHRGHTPSYVEGSLAV